MSKIYISGKIAGIREEAPQLFAIGEAQVEAMGHEAVNPMELPDGGEKTWEEFMRRDIKAMCDCDGIYMLNNWRESNGAKVELDLAIKLGMDALFQKPKTVEENE